ncbi:MAG: N-6 DNA methylase [Armatimonadetes bacterium]|nr:N-6 DNA methylase [Armatimonadota bacterium]
MEDRAVPPSPFSEYRARLESDIQAGVATEHTYRPALKALVDALCPDGTAFNEPRRVECGAPDFVVVRETPHGPLNIGHIETKDVGADLNAVERSDQLRRYRGGLANLILTDYLEFRWYVDGERRLTARWANLEAGGRLRVDRAGQEAARVLLESFLQHAPEPISSPRELALRMAGLARLIHAVIVEAFDAEKESPLLRGLRDSFARVLLPGLTTADFADMFAQTLAYGLFAARCNHPPATRFQRLLAARDIPATNPFLAHLFEQITGIAMDEEPFAGFVDDLAQLLADADMAAILDDFGRRARREDAVVHFYETFLAHYDARLREVRGVYYTPEPVVSYIVRSVDLLLRRDFGLPDGLADDSQVAVPAPSGEGEILTHKVQILDPATGTGTFLHAVVNRICERFENNQGMWPGYVSAHLLPRLFGFELLMAPYAVAHLKLGLLLRGTGYAFPRHERLRVYLTNTLEEAAHHPETFLAQFLSAEANAAGAVKQEAPVMVVLGNPPYSGHSANKGEWIAALLHGRDIQPDGSEQTTGSYFHVDGQPLGERNPKWLNDDYVKFIRFAQWRIERTGCGILAFITNHGYLDNPTFRGMRRSLMQTFDDIYLLDLHGNSKKRERAPDGSRDDNVFDIQQGVAIGIFVKRPNAPGEAPTVRHAHLWGVRDAYQETPEGSRLVGGKYHWLWENDVASTEWTALEPQAPFYLFAPQDADIRAEYASAWKVTDAMPLHVLGFQSHRDHFAIAFDEGVMRQRILDLRDARRTDEQVRSTYGLSDNSSWSLSAARAQLRSDGDWNSRLIRCLYRPWDWRACYYSTAAMDRPRPELQQHMLRPNLSLNTMRQTKAEQWRHAMVADTPTSAVFVEVKDGSTAFPLYLYPNGSPEGLFDVCDATGAPGGRRPNLAARFVDDFSERLGMEFVPDGQGDRQATFGPEDVFHYLYAVLHSPGYRGRYAEFLKMDFPRIPLTRSPDLFRALCAFGAELVRLHLMDPRPAGGPTFPVPGDNRVEAPRYTEPALPHPPACGGNEGGMEAGRVWINRTQYFEGVPPEVWEFHVGGYQVCHKWLKDRKGRALSYDDLRHYQGIVVALGETIRLMAEIDVAIEEHGGWPIV